MSKKTIVFLFLLMLSPVIIYFLWPTDEARIRKLIKEGAAAIEKEDAEAVLSKVSLNYEDEHGINYMLLGKILEQEFNALSGIKVEYENVKITVSKDKASAKLDLRVIATAGTETGYIVGSVKEPARFSLELEKGATRSWLVVKSAGLEAY